MGQDGAADGSSPSPGNRGVRLRLAGAVLFGAAAVGVLWLVLGGGGSSATASFQVSPGTPPVVFLYLDNGHIASYLSQLQGGSATIEQLSRQATASKNASVGVNGVSAGGSSSQESTAALTLTVTNQSRFTSLLDLLQTDGFLHTVDMGARDRLIKREFAAVPNGAFVKLTNCTLTLPTYVQDEELWRAARGHLSAYQLYRETAPTSARFPSPMRPSITNTIRRARGLRRHSAPLCNSSHFQRVNLSAWRDRRWTAWYAA